LVEICPRSSARLVTLRTLVVNSRHAGRLARVGPGWRRSFFLRPVPFPVPAAGWSGDVGAAAALAAGPGDDGAGGSGCCA
jgi:hypothetical protein